MDGVAAEVLKAGGSTLTNKLTNLYKKAWYEGKLPQDFKDASMVHLYKRKGAQAVCDNHRGIALLSVPGKVLAKVLATRLYSCIAEPYLSESQCGFRPGRGCTDIQVHCQAADGKMQSIQHATTEHATAMQSLLI